MDRHIFLVQYTHKTDAPKKVLFSNSVRQFFVDNYPNPFFHNHYPNGKSIIRKRGAPFQFKVVNNEVVIVALNEGIDFAESFQWPLEIKMPLGKHGQYVEIGLSSKTLRSAKFSETEFQSYRNVTPYMALNENHYRDYLTLSEQQKRQMVEKGLTDHILTAAKWCGVEVKQRIQTNLLQMRTEIPIKIKNNLIFLPFDVVFECNTEIPDYLGIGKFVSRGYGTMVKYG